MSNLPRDLMGGGVVLYGSPPKPESPIDIPAIPPPVLPVPILTSPMLLPCTKCQRHVYVGQPCPFCFADESKEAAKSPGRIALDAAEKALTDARNAIDSALEDIKKAKNG